MKIRVFYKSLDTTSSAPPKSLKEQLASLKEELRAQEEKKVNNPEQEKGIKSLKRKIARLEGFDNAQEGKDINDPIKKQEVQTILKGKTSETYLGSDLHMLKERGIDIASLTLVMENNPSQAANSVNMKVGDKLVVNFGGNGSLKKKTGAGDILPPEVTEIEINGVKCERRNSPRPGFYKIEAGKNPVYQKIYDGYAIKILASGAISDTDRKAADEAAEKRWRKIRAEDMIEHNEGNPLIGFPEEQTLFSEVLQERNRIGREKSREMSRDLFPKLDKETLSKITLRDVSQEEINEVLHLKTFPPYSRDAVILFSYAAKTAGLPEEWGKSNDLHYILEHESHGKTGSLNYQLSGRGIGEDFFKTMASDGYSNLDFGVKSTASGLGQMTLQNIDKGYYPDGRNGIGDPLNEAIGMLRYIDDRYGSPQVAREMYSKTGAYLHARTSAPMTKTFREGY